MGPAPEPVPAPEPATEPSSEPAPAPPPAGTVDAETVDTTPATSPPAPPPGPADPGDPEDPAATGPVPADLEGRWEGGIAIAGPADLPFAVDLTASGDGLRGTMDIQGNFGLPLSSVTLDAGRLHFELESPLGLAVWDGEVGDEVIEGDFTQAGMAETFWMQRFEDPSEDGPGASFRRTEVVFASGDITLAGELTFPSGDGPHPAVVLISGSGEQDRDSNVSGFRLFAVLADHLAGAGVASLRFDDRGVGGSGGDNLQATLEDRVGDVEAAIDVLRSRDDIAAGGIGLVGHSEGGIVAPVVANRTAVAFVGMLAAPVLPLRETVEAQQLELLEQSGATAEEVEQFRAFQELVFSAVATGQGWDEVEATLRALVQQQFEAMPAQSREAIPDEEAMVDSIVAEELAAWQSPLVRVVPGVRPRAGDRRPRGSGHRSVRRVGHAGSGARQLDRHVRRHRRVERPELHDRHDPLGEPPLPGGRDRQCQRVRQAEARVRRRLRGDPHRVVSRLPQGVMTR